MIASTEIAANTSNAHHATGPRTEAGKARSAQNARTHGLTAKELVIAPEDAAEFEELLADYQSEIDPQGAIEHTLFDELVSSAWNLRRIRRMETELCASAATYTELLENEAIQKKLDRLARHKTRIERTFHRSLRELKALQTNTALVPLLPRPIAEISPALASASQISKRTQVLQRGGNAGMLRTVLQAIDNEADAFLCATRAKTRIEELEKQVEPADQAA